ncbi:hypothetical protein ACE6H2_019803 [Prunus campanulata]
MIIRDELPFSHVEGIGFREFLKEAQPRFDLPSHTTIARDVWDLYQEEKAKIKSVLTHNAQRVSLTTDTWTSIQNINYMVLTAHFIDDDWVLHKRILNFCVIPNHKGDTIGRLVEACLNGWGIDKVFTISVDNASSNDGCISYMKKRLEKWNSLIGDDPRYKMEYVEFCLGDLVFDENGVNDMTLEIKTLLHTLYDYYRKQNPAAAQVFHANESEGSLHVNNDVTKSSRLQKFLKSRRDKDVVEIRNEIDKYLLEPPVNLINDEFKLLDWWKENATKFPILSNVAKDVFAVQASTRMSLATTKNPHWRS